jgi:hypothetical protein
VADVALRDDLTVSDRVGAWPELAVSLLALALLGLAVFGHRRRRDVGSEPTPATEESLS